MISINAINISPMCPGTVEAVAEIERLCFSSPWSADALKAELENPLAVFKTAAFDGIVAGYAGMHHVVDEGYITNVAVNPDYRRRGGARALVEALIRYAEEHGLRMITLEVREGNEAARRLYSALGFEIAGRRKSFYSRPVEDAVLMTREFIQAKA